MRKLNSRNATSLHILYIASMLHVLILLDLFLVDMKYIFEASVCTKMLDILSISLVQSDLNLL